MFKCEQCSSDFSRLDSLKRHVNTVHSNRIYRCPVCSSVFSSQKEKVSHVCNDIKCEVCGKEFSHVGTKNRHVQTVHEKKVEFECDRCSKRFTRKDVLAKHLEGCQGEYKCEVCDQVFGDRQACWGHKREHRKRKLGDDKGPFKPMEVDPIRPDDSIEEQVYKDHWSSIRTHHVLGQNVQDRYNFRLETLSTDDLPLQDIFKAQQHPFKVNLSYGFVLHNNESGEKRYYHPSQNNARVLDQPILVRNQVDLDKFKESVKQVDLLEWARQQRPNSKWVVDKVTNCTVYINKIRDHPIGYEQALPDYVKKNAGLVALERDENHNFQYTDNLCFFRCLALHQGSSVHALQTDTMHYYQEAMGTGDKFKGVTLGDLDDMELEFDVNVNVYTLDENGTVSTVRRSTGQHATTMDLNLYKTHFSYIRDWELYATSFRCSKCGQLWKDRWSMHRHEETCNEETVYKYPGGVYHLPQTVFDKLEDEGLIIEDDLKYYPYRATYDFEVYFDKSDLPEGADKLEWKAKHVPLSVSVCSNVPGYEEPKCFITEGDSYKLVEKMMVYLEEIGDTAYNLLLERYEPVFEQLQEKIDVALQLEPGDKQHPLEKLRDQLVEYLREMPVVGFNSGKFDINVIKVYLVKYLMGQIEFTVKKNNNMMCLKTKKFKFLDMVNYLSPGCSYEKFLRAFKCEVTKGFLPYEWIDDLSKLDCSELPPHSAFYSQLKGKNISEEEYEYCQQVWEEQSMSSFREFLVWYNDRDVKPFLEAIEKQAAFYREKHTDMFKDGISVPGLTLKYLFENLPEDVYFTLYGEAELHKLVKDQIVGGPSVVFSRYHEKGVTKIKEKDYGEEAEWCQSCVGWDANALYLSCLMKEMPTKWYVRRKADTGFRPETSHKWGRSKMEWLEWVMIQEGVNIRHEFNGKEKRIGRRQLPVDGWCQETQTVYQHQGCFWHGCECLGKTVNEVKGVDMAVLREETRENTEYLEKLGYKVVEMWECDWKREKANNKELQKFIGMMHRRRMDKKQEMTEEEILQCVQEGTLFGMVECDIETPAELKSTFKEMPPVFKNVEVSRDDVGDMMRQYAEEHKIMQQPRRMLISSYFGQKILLTTPLLQWYLAHGLKVTKIYQVMQYWPETCFEQFGKDVSDARRDGDSDPDKSIVADAMKLYGNSGYGKTVTNKERHVEVRYCDDQQATGFINNQRFKHLNTLGEDSNEVEMKKKIIKLDLPLHIGFFVYQYAKLRMLEFYHDFLLKYVDDRKIELGQMDTDSLYAGLAGQSLEEVVRPELKEEFYREWNEWLPAEACDQHFEQFVQTKLAGCEWRGEEPCCVARKKFDKRTPGLFKKEWEGDGIVSLCSKTYYCFGTSDKYSSKGLNKGLNRVTKDKYLEVLRSRKNGTGTNVGFRVKDNVMYTYSQQRDALSYFYGKRKVLENGLESVPLNI